MDGMDAPMRLSDFLAAAKLDADQMRAEAPDFVLPRHLLTKGMLADKAGRSNSGG
jgi:hypothetical protein